jgi:hypothetical protein
MLRFQNEKRNIRMHKITSYIFISVHLRAPLTISSLRSALMLRWIWFWKQWLCLRRVTVRSGRCSPTFQRKLLSLQITYCLLGLFVELEDGGRMLLRKLGELLQDWPAPPPRIQCSSTTTSLTYRNPQFAFLHRALLHIIFIRNTILKIKNCSY